MTDPTTTPCPGPCAAVRSEDSAGYSAETAPESTETERLDRGGPAALASHELLGLLGVRIDAPALAAAGGCADSATTRTTPGTTRRSRTTTCCGSKALLEVHARWMAARLAPFLGAGP